MKLSPILLFTYNRLYCLEETINNLKKNTLSKYSNLYIYSDGFKSIKDKENVEKVRDYLKTIKGFKNVTVILRNKNFGLAANIIDGVSTIIKKYKKAIILEDDLITGKYFLQYLNDSLDLYEYDNDVICINGYSYINSKETSQTYFLKTADNLGWGTWERGWELFEENSKKLYDEIMSNKLKKKFNRNNNYPFLKMLEDQMNGSVDSWAIRWYASAFLKNKYTLYPKYSLVKHIGNDKNATHYNNTDSLDPLDVNLSNNKILVKKIKVLERKKIGNLYNAFLRKYTPPLLKRFKNKIMRLISSNE